MKTENKMLELMRCMRIENVLALGFMVNAALRVNEVLSKGATMTPQMWIAAATPFILHIFSYNLIKSSYDSSADNENEMKKIKNPITRSLSYLIIPFIGPIKDRFSLPKKS